MDPTEPYLLRTTKIPELITSQLLYCANWTSLAIVVVVVVQASGYCPWGVNPSVYQSI